MNFPKLFIYGFCIVFILANVLMAVPSHGKGADFENVWQAEGFIFFLILLFVGIGFIIYYKWRYNKAMASWESGVFNSKQAFTDDSLLEAYIRLGGLMLRKDQDDLKGKMSYLHRYFEQHFVDTDFDLIHALKGSFQNPVKLSSITPWLKRNLHSVSQRSQLIYFLAGLSIVDGSINPREKQFLVQLSDLLELSKKDFDSIMAMYTKYEDAYRDQFKQSKPTKSQQEYRREKAAKILGISVQASPDEIKKAYRSLAKKHHPDRFATESKAQQEIAEERFVQIQKAYELMLS